ncbi:TrbI/VirB10 family protein [Bartonella sp. DGB2]|uniref:TrbI/VirB10 family protein n=1 Tax=Bartonella sp. DGB2 TaxID=3388426 RepID=UPI00398FB126
MRKKSKHTSLFMHTKKVGGRSLNNLPIYLFIGGLVAFLIIIGLVMIDRTEKTNIENVDPAKKKIDSSKALAEAIINHKIEGIIPERKKTKDTHASSETLEMLSHQQASSNDESSNDTSFDDNTDQKNRKQSKQENQKNILKLPPSLGYSNQSLGMYPPDYTTNTLNLTSNKMQMLSQAAKARTTVPISMRHQSSDSLSLFSNTTTGVPKTREEVQAKIAQINHRLQTLHNENAGADTQYMDKLQQIQSMVSGAASGQSTPSDGERRKNEYSQFSDNSVGDRWKLNSQLENPKSPYEIRAGFIIPAVMISGINSELPGQIIAQVSQNVYDTATGKYVLIPQGARLVGSYSSDVSYGQSRVLVGWQRVIFPDGRAIDIGGMPGTDAGGYSGFTDQVNNHYFRIFGSAILMSAITAGVSISQGTNGLAPNTPPTISSQMNAALGQQLGQVSAQMIQKNMNISPTLEIRPGYRFNIMVVKDLVFPSPYRSFAYHHVKGR